MSEILAFTDGGSIMNPGPGGWSVVYLNKTTGVVTELGGRETKATNNRMEMIGVINALSLVEQGDIVEIYTDSAYVVNGINVWMDGWKKNNWKKKTGEFVLNMDLWKEINEILEKKNDIVFHHIAGHSGLPGNERADVIANSFARNTPTKLLSGLTLKEYENSIGGKLTIVKLEKPFYLSMINGEIQKHDTWTECKARVDGRKAKFKKISSKAEEESIRNQWQSLLKT